jgi:radical SAM superfamily enzyme YgiQ (UPF0313 family)
MENLKIALIRPPYVLPKTAVFGNRGLPALGTAYLSASLKRDGHDVTCIDGFAEDMDKFTRFGDTDFLVNGISKEEIVDLIPEDVRLIGVSSMFSNDWLNTSELIQYIKQERPNAFLVMGGEHVSADIDFILEQYQGVVDCCVKGEGENKIRELAREIKMGNYNKETIPGISYFCEKTKQTVTNEGEYRVKNINDIPSPDWTGLRIEEFHRRKMGMSSMKKITIPMLISRGCPYRCTFCTSPDMWTTKWIPRDADLVIDEIKSYVRDYGIEHIDFLDLTAIVNKKWTIDFCQKLIKEDLGITWSLPSGTRSEALTPEVLHLLKESGCEKLTYAPETGSPRLSELIQKRCKLDNMLKSMKSAVDQGVIVKVSMIYGFPDEKFSDVLQSLWFILKLAFIGVHDVSCFGFTPYPGSHLFRRLEKEKVIKRDDNYYLFLAGLVYTRPFNTDTWNGRKGFLQPILMLGSMSMFYFFQYLFRPVRLVRTIKSIAADEPTTMLDAALCNIYKDVFKGGRKDRISSTNAALGN